MERTSKLSGRGSMKGSFRKFFNRDLDASRIGALAGIGACSVSAQPQPPLTLNGRAKGSHMCTESVCVCVRVHPLSTLFWLQEVL